LRRQRTRQLAGRVAAPAAFEQRLAQAALQALQHAEHRRCVDAQPLSRSGQCAGTVQSQHQGEVGGREFVLHGCNLGWLVCVFSCAECPLKLAASITVFAEAS
jgi:hypothetical protein